MFWRKPTPSFAQISGQKVLDVVSLIQRLNELMEGLPGVYYFKFMPGVHTPRHVALIDGSFVPTSKQFGYEEPVAAPEPPRTPMDKIVHGLQERQKRTIIFDFIDADDGVVTLRTRDGQRATLTPEQINAVLLESPIRMFVEAMRFRQEEIDERDLDGMGYGDPRMTPEQAMEPNPLFADLPFKPAPGGKSFTYARDNELPKTIPYTVEPPETAAATFTQGERVEVPPYDFQARTPLNLMREGREHEIGLDHPLADAIASGIEEISRLPPRLVIEEPPAGAPGGPVPLPDDNGPLD